VGLCHLCCRNLFLACCSLWGIMLENLLWLLLELRRHFLVVFFYKILYGCWHHIYPTSSIWGHRHLFTIPFARTDTYLAKFFSPSTTKLWNLLPDFLTKLNRNKLTYPCTSSLNWFMYDYLYTLFWVLHSKYNNHLHVIVYR